VELPLLQIELVHYFRRISTIFAFVQIDQADCRIIREVARVNQSIVKVIFIEGFSEAKLKLSCPEMSFIFSANYDFLAPITFTYGFILSWIFQNFLESSLIFLVRGICHHCQFSIPVISSHANNRTIAIGLNIGCRK